MTVLVPDVVAVLLREVDTVVLNVEDTVLLAVVVSVLDTVVEYDDVTVVVKLDVAVDVTVDVAEDVTVVDGEVASHCHEPATYLSIMIFSDAAVELQSSMGDVDSLLSMVKNLLNAHAKILL